MKILALDTATERCSAALWIDDVLLLREVEVDRGHADRILSMIDELLAEGGAPLTALTAIAFGRGPGSFTGVRLAASVTQGLAFGADLPVVPVSDLLAVAQQSAFNAALRQVLVCNDARMQEVYWACFERGSDQIMVASGKEFVGKPATVAIPMQWPGESAFGAGRGFAAYPQLRAQFETRLAAIDDRILPSAREIAVLAAVEVAAGRVFKPEEAVPVYLRDDVARPK